MLLIAFAFLGTAAAQTPKFEAASIKPCRTGMPDGARSGGGNSSPGRLNVECQTVKGLIQAAYVIFVNGRSVAPSWVRRVAMKEVHRGSIPTSSLSMQGLKAMQARS